MADILAHVCVALALLCVYMLNVILNQRLQLHNMTEQLEQIAADLGAVNKEITRG